MAKTLVTPPSLSPYRLKKARRVYDLFTMLNAVAWALIAGNIITIFAMRLRASATYIGVLSAMTYVSYLFLSVGRLAVSHLSVMTVFRWAWFCRSLSMAPLVAVPFVFLHGDRELALMLTLLGVGGFNFFRGVGMIANNPVVSSLAVGPDRGSYMTQNQLIDSGFIMAGGLAVSLILGKTAPFPLYAAFVSVGIGLGVTSSIVLRKVPEPEGIAGAGDDYQDPRDPPHRGKSTFFIMLREHFALPSFRHFVGVFFCVVFVSAIARNFLLLYARQVFSQSDSMVSFLTVAGGLGNMSVFVLIKFFVDRIGVKPLYIVCTIICLGSLIPVVAVSPVFFSAGVNGTGATAYLLGLFFLVTFGFLGAEGIARTYFLAMVPQKHMLDMGIVYYFVFGLGGAGGTFLAGLSLDIFASFGVSPGAAFSMLFAGLALILAGVLVAQKWLVPLGSLSFAAALSVMFSPRDLKAIALLDRLNKSRGSGEELDVLEQLRDAPSSLAIKGLLERVKSPQLAVRMEALHALEAQDSLTSDAETALLDDLTHNPFTTAYVSARILGTHGVGAAIPILRDLALSTDSILAGEALISLANLHDEVYRSAAERIVTDTDNPRLKIMGATALGLFADTASIATLLGILEDADPPPYLREEVALAVSKILGTEDDFYPLLARVRDDVSLCVTLAVDEAEAATETFVTAQGGKKRLARHAARDPELLVLAQALEKLIPAVSQYMHENKGSALAEWLSALPEDLGDPRARAVLTQAVLSDSLSAIVRLKLLICHWACRLFRDWSAERT